MFIFKMNLEINKFLDEYYDKYTGLYLKSKDFLKNIVKCYLPFCENGV